MITLYISSSINIDEIHIVKCLLIDKVECQISKNVSSCIPCNGSEMVIEYGYKLKIFNVAKQEFKDRIWLNLHKILADIKCGHIITEYYTGCVLNWPGVFIDNNCNAESNNDMTMDL